MEIPKGYRFEGIGSDHGSEHRFWYPDSSVIYLTTETGTLNYATMRSQGIWYKWFDAVHNNDSLTLAGQDRNGRYWKDELTSMYIIGYSNVPPNSKMKFDCILTKQRITLKH